MTAVPTIALATLGCKVNQAETMGLLSQLQQDVAVVPFDQAADIYLINTCTVTHEADRQSRQLIRRAHRKNPQAAIVV
ncbi:MAG: tRNA (N(6)-L-threonylcarbamoyladenosine(37)-C(2))-methylthiotransferase MtaB, partial [Candidatus Sericytochromatia bacterium]|nr:tRNA (N(6)-L-threonylcarbamoyladenosine(37)-C(2))-methylthiotransferase MtaB [Candidatus Tanganyikabacteria bacterium]